MHPERQRGMNNIVLMNDGVAVYVPIMYFESVCTGANLIDPWAEQECSLKYGSRTYDGVTMNIGSSSGVTYDFYNQEHCQVEVSLASFDGCKTLSTERFGR